MNPLNQNMSESSTESSDITHINISDFSEKPVRDLIWLLASPNLINTVFVHEEKHISAPFPPRTFPPAPSSFLLPPGSLQILKKWDADPTVILDFLLSGSRVVGPPKLGNYASALLNCWFEIGLPEVLSMGLGSGLGGSGDDKGSGGIKIKVLKSVSIVNKMDYQDKKILDQTSLKFVLRISGAVGDGGRGSGGGRGSSGGEEGDEETREKQVSVLEKTGVKKLEEETVEESDSARRENNGLLLSDLHIDDAFGDEKSRSQFRNQSQNLSNTRVHTLVHVEANVKFFVRTAEGSYKGPSMSESLDSRREDLRRKHDWFLGMRPWYWEKAAEKVEEKVEEDEEVGEKARGERKAEAELQELEAEVGDVTDIKEAEKVEKFYFTKPKLPVKKYHPSSLGELNPNAWSCYMLRGYIFQPMLKNDDVNGGSNNGDGNGANDRSIDLNPSHLNGFLTQDITKEDFSPFYSNDDDKNSSSLASSSSSPLSSPQLHYVILPKLWWMTSLSGKIKQTSFGAESEIGRKYESFFGCENIFPETLAEFIGSPSSTEKKEQGNNKDNNKEIISPGERIEKTLPEAVFPERGATLRIFSDPEKIDDYIQTILFPNQPTTPVMVAVLKCCNDNGDKTWREIHRGFVLPRQWNPDDPDAHLLAVQNRGKRGGRNRVRMTPGSAESNEHARRKALLRFAWGQLDERLREFFFSGEQGGEGDKADLSSGHDKSQRREVSVSSDGNVIPDIKTQMKALESFRRALDKKRRREEEGKGDEDALKTNDAVEDANNSENNNLVDLTWLTEAMEMGDLGNLDWVVAARGLVLLWPWSLQGGVGGTVEACNASKGMIRDENGELHPGLKTLLKRIVKRGEDRIVFDTDNEGSVLDCNPAAIELWLLLEEKIPIEELFLGGDDIPEGVLRLRRYFQEKLSKKTRTDFLHLLEPGEVDRFLSIDYSVLFNDRGSDSITNSHKDLKNNSHFDSSSEFLRLPFIPAFRDKDISNDLLNDISTPSTSPESPGHQTQTEINDKNKNLFIYQIDSPAKLYSWLGSSSVTDVEVPRSRSSLDIGIDCEWQPGSKNKMALSLVQIAVRDKVFIIDGVIDGVLRSPTRSEQIEDGDGAEVDLEQIQSDRCRSVFLEFVKIAFQAFDSVRVVAWGKEDFRRLGLMECGNSNSVTEQFLYEKDQLRLNDRLNLIDLSEFRVISSLSSSSSRSIQLKSSSESINSSLSSVSEETTLVPSINTPNPSNLPKTTSSQRCSSSISLNEALRSYFRDKSLSKRYQCVDWGYLQRPLPGPVMEYAALDGYAVLSLWYAIESAEKLVEIVRSYLSSKHVPDVDVYFQAPVDLSKWKEDVVARVYGKSQLDRNDENENDKDKNGKLSIPLIRGPFSENIMRVKTICFLFEIFEPSMNSLNDQELGFLKSSGIKSTYRIVALVPESHRVDETKLEECVYDRLNWDSVPCLGKYSGTHSSSHSLRKASAVEVPSRFEMPLHGVGPFNVVNTGSKNGGKNVALGMAAANHADYTVLGNDLDFIVMCDFLVEEKLKGVGKDGGGKDKVEKGVGAIKMDGKSEGLIAVGAGFPDVEIIMGKERMESFGHILYGDFSCR